MDGGPESVTISFGAALGRTGREERDLSRHAGVLGILGLIGLAAFWFFVLREPAPGGSGRDGIAPYLKPEFPVGILSDEPDEIRWRPVDEAAGYEVEIMDGEERVLWKAKSSAAAVLFPEEVRKPFRERKALFYIIKATDQRGKAIARCAPVRFRLATSAAESGLDHSESGDR